MKNDDGEKMRVPKDVISTRSLMSRKKAAIETRTADRIVAMTGACVKELIEPKNLHQAKHHI